MKYLSSRIAHKTGAFLPKKSCSLEVVKKGREEKWRYFAIVDSFYQKSGCCKKMANFTSDCVAIKAISGSDWIHFSRKWQGDFGYRWMERLVAQHRKQQALFSQTHKGFLTFVQFWKKEWFCCSETFSILHRRGMEAYILNEGHIFCLGDFRSSQKSLFFENTEQSHREIPSHNREKRHRNGKMGMAMHLH